MSRDSDEFDEMSSHQIVAGGATPDDQDAVAQFLVELRALGRGRPPEPSPQVAALLGGATLLAPRRHAARVVARSAIAAAVLIAALVIAAVNRDLPQPAQRVVSDVVTVLTPFDIAPNNAAPPTPTHLPTPTKQPTPTTQPIAPGEDDSSSPGRTDDPTGSQRGAGSDDGVGSAPATSEREDGGGAAPPTAEREDGGGTTPRAPQDG